MGGLFGEIRARQPPINLVDLWRGSQMIRTDAGAVGHGVTGLIRRPNGSVVET